MVNEVMDFVLDPFDDRLISDPYPAYTYLREEAPLHFDDRLGTLWISRYEDVKTVLMAQDGVSSRTKTAQLGLSRTVDLGHFGRTNTLPTLDEPAHTRLRKLTMPQFRPRPVREMQSDIESIIGEHLAAAERENSIEIVAQLATAVPIRVIAQMLGVPVERDHEFAQWSKDLTRAFLGPRMTVDDVTAANGAVANIEGLFLAEREARLACPYIPADGSTRTDLLTALMDSEGAEEPLTQAEYLATAVLLLVAGNETTTSLIANGLYELFSRPDQLSLLKADPSLIDSAVEEMLRFAGPVHMVVRRATEDLELSGGTVPAGSAMTLLVGAANRDPRQFPDPDTFDITCTPNDHLAFGRGRHLCLGATLSRLESTLAINALLRRFPDAKLGMSEPPRWIGSLATRGVNRLDLTIR